MCPASAAWPEEAEVAVQTLDAAVEAALLSAATRLVGDPAEARGLLALTLETAAQVDGRTGPPGQAELFLQLRRAYHSVQRTRRRRPMRDAMVSSLAQGQQADTSDPTP
jgi:hypothetical protein